MWLGLHNIKFSARCCVQFAAPGNRLSHCLCCLIFRMTAQIGPLGPASRIPPFLLHSSWWCVHLVCDFPGRRSPGWSVRLLLVLFVCLSSWTNYTFSMVRLRFHSWFLHHFTLMIYCLCQSYTCTLSTACFATSFMHVACLACEQFVRRKRAGVYVVMRPGHQPPRPPVMPWQFFYGLRSHVQLAGMLEGVVLHRVCMRLIQHKLAYICSSLNVTGWQPGCFSGLLRVCVVTCCNRT